MDVRAAVAFDAGKINIDDLITRAMPLEKINDAFALMHKGEGIRGMVVY